MEREKEVIALCKGGLSNRIKTLITCMKISEEEGRTMKVYWPENKYCNDPIEGFFENKFELLNEEDLGERTKKKKYFCFNKRKKKKQYVFVDDPQFKLFSKEDIYLKFEKTPKKYIKEISYFLNKLKIKKEVLEKANNFYNSLGKNPVGVFIRRGDFLLLKGDIWKVSSPDLFIKEIKKESIKDSKRVFYIATEDWDLKRNLTKIFGSKIKIFPRRTKTREESHSTVESFVELLILSKCPSLIGSYGSTFPEMSWFLSKGKQRVKIVTDEEYLKKYLRKPKADFITRFIKRPLYVLFIPKKNSIIQKTPKISVKKRSNILYPIKTFL